MRVCHKLVPILLVLLGVLCVVLLKTPVENVIQEQIFERNVEAAIDGPEFEMKIQAYAKSKSAERNEERETHEKDEEVKNKETEEEMNKDVDEKEVPVTQRKDVEKDLPENIQEGAKELKDDKNGKKNNESEKTSIGKEEDAKELKDDRKGKKDVESDTPSVDQQESIKELTHDEKAGKKDVESEKLSVDKVEQSEIPKTIIVKEEIPVKYLYRERSPGETFQEKIIAFKKAIEYEGHLNETKTVFAEITKLAEMMLTKTRKLILLTFVSEKNVPFIKSWLCNTKYLDVHQSVIIVTLDKTARTMVKTNWPKIRVFNLKPRISGTSLQNTSTILRKLQVVNSLLRAGINLILFDAQSVWFKNPIPVLQTGAEKGYDMLVNVIQMAHVNTGFMVLFATERTQSFWITLYGELRYIENKMGGGNTENQKVDFQNLLLDMVLSRYV